MDLQTELPMSFLRWSIGLSLPGILLACGAAVTLWAEYRTPYVAAHLGEYLLRRNDERQERGSVWQGILANRQSRTAVDSLARRAPVNLTTLPPALLEFRFSSENRGTNLYVLQAHRRTPPLRLDPISGETMQSLAHSLEIYRRGENLLSHIELPRESFQIQARIRFKVALDDNALFPLLHRELDAMDAPLAWNFIKMSPEDQNFWRDRLQLFSIRADADSTAFADLQTVNPELVRACQNLLHTWEIALYTAEIERLQGEWRSGAERTIRLVRDIDVFAGYLISPGSIATRFTIPTAEASAILDRVFSRETSP